MKKRRGTPSYNRIVTGVFALILCASAAQADSRKGSLSALGKKAIYGSANVLDPVLQAKTVTGKVVDASGEALIGVSIGEQGTTKGTTTDANGNYTISVTGDNSVLVFTYLGYETLTQTVGARTVVNVTLQNRTSNLAEVVVTALGIKREARKVGTSVTSANVEELQQNRTTNVMTGLEGKVAGLNVSPPAAGAGASNRIRLRGQSGFNGTNNAPLIVINGLPMDQGAQGAFQGNGADPTNNFDRGDALQQINPDDIENMTVLKGATAAALYGSRAGNGAILITTKSGSKNSKFGVEFSSNFAADEALDYTRFQDQYGFGQLGQKPTNLPQALNGGGFSFGAKYDGSDAFFYDGKLRPYKYDPDRIKNFYRTGTSFTNTVALTGGNASTSYRASFSNQDVKGLMPNNDYHKKIFNMGVNSKISDKLTFTFNVNYTKENNNNPPLTGLQGAGAPNFLQRLGQGIPLDVVREFNTNPLLGTEYQTSATLQGTLLNPYYSMPKQFNRRSSDRFLSTTTLRYDAHKYFYVQGRVALDFNTGLSERNNPHGVGQNTLFQSNTPPYFQGNYYNNTFTSRNMNYDFLMGTNNHKIGDFSWELTVGGNIRDDKYRSVDLTGEAFVVKDLYTIGNSVTKTGNYSIDRSQVNSLYAVADFGFKSYLYLSVTDRVDWFSVLTPPSSIVPNPKNSYNYPSISGSFVFSELLPNVSWLNYGKLRASYADVGSSSGIGAFQGQLTYNIPQNPFIANGTSYILASIANGNNPNPLIQPYGISEKEIGLELKTLGNRLNFDFAVYEKLTNNQIITVQQSQASGYNGTPRNFGKLRNRGMEILVEGTPIRTGKFSWNSSLNGAYNESTVLELAPGQQSFQINNFNANGNEFLGRLTYEKGMALNQLVAKTYRRDAQGRVVLQANGRLTDVRNDPDKFYGSADPKWTGGWNNTFRYDKLSLLVHIDYKFGGKVFSSTAINGLRQGYSQASLVGREGGVIFDGVLPNGNRPTVGVNPQDFYGDYRTFQIADPFVFSSDFIKLRNITLAYDFSTLVKNAKFIKGLTLSASCRNVAILHKAIPDLDPEAFASSGDNRLGYEQATLPTTRTFGLNLNVKF